MMMMMMMTMMMLTMTFAIAYRLQDGVTFSPDPMHRDVQPADNVAATFLWRRRQKARDRKKEVEVLL